MTMTSVMVYRAQHSAARVQQKINIVRFYPYCYNHRKNNMIDREARLMEEIVSRIRRASQPVQIVLFGSSVRGDAGPDSDLDILVVVPNGTHRRRTARDIFLALSGIGRPKDIVVVTEEDIKNYGSNPSFVIAPALKEGRELYHAAG
jgi:predicted nucleotidyltransferase